jgi:hypothetical protein
MAPPNFNMVPKCLDLAARSLDLISTLVKSSGTLGEVAQDIIAWRGREGIDERQLTLTLELAKDFAYPNVNGRGNARMSGYPS